MLLPDGAGLELAARLHGCAFRRQSERHRPWAASGAGAGARGLSLFLLGAAPGVAEQAGARLQTLAPGLRIAGTRDGFAGLRDAQAAIDAINASGADMVWMATGVPHQDLWLAGMR